MTKKQNYIKPIYLLLIAFLLIVTLVSGQGILSAFADSTSITSALEDLQKDKDFDIEKYPQKPNDYTLQVIQIAESTAGEVFLYVYRPYIGAYDLNATTVRISITVGENYSPKDYKVTLLNSDGVFQKYVVNDLKVKSYAMRYYDVVAIHRKYISKIDGSIGGGNTIDEVGFRVEKLFTACTVNDTVTYSCEQSNVIEVTDKYVGFVRYLENRYWLGKNLIDCHFVAFNADMKIDRLYQADVEWDYQPKKTTTTSISGGAGMPPQNISNTEDDGDGGHTGKTVSYDENVDINTVDFFKWETHSWLRVQTSAEFLESEEDLYPEAVERIEKMQWVLRFTETPFTVESINFGTANVTKFMDISSVTILRLYFITNGEVYNLGVVDNKQTGSGNPDNPVGGLDGSLDWLEALCQWLESVTGVPALAWKIIFCAIPFIILLPILAAIFPVVGQVLLMLVKGLCLAVKYLFIGLWWIICLPFKGIVALIKRGKSDDDGEKKEKKDRLEKKNSTPREKKRK